MSDNFFKKLSEELDGMTPGKATRLGKEAIEWYKDRVKGASSASISMIMYGKRGIDTFYPGQLFTFRYQSKLFEEGSLPYFDAAPLVIALGQNRYGNLEGLNLHYLPPHVRLRILSYLVKTIGDAGAEKLRHDTKLFRISYAAAQNIAALRPLEFALKSYIPDRIFSKPVRVQPREYKHAIALPYQQFVGASSRKVWSDGKSFFK